MKKNKTYKYQMVMPNDSKYLFLRESCWLPFVQYYRVRLFEWFDSEDIVAIVLDYILDLCYAEIKKRCVLNIFKQSVLVYCGLHAHMKTIMLVGKHDLYHLFRTEKARKMLHVHFMLPGHLDEREAKKLNEMTWKILFDVYKAQEPKYIYIGQLCITMENVTVRPVMARRKFKECLIKYICSNMSLRAY